MAVEAPISKHKKANFKLYIVFCVGIAIILGYDGYLSKYEWSKRYDFYKKHVIDKGGKPDSTMVSNRVASPVLIGIAALLGAYLFAVRNKKLIADENELVISDKEKISYDSIQKIDKTYFDSKGYFVITYKNKDGREVDRKIGDKTYDNLAAILELLTAKIS